MEFSDGDSAPLINNLQAAQAAAPFEDREGLVAATLQSGDTQPPLGQCLNTPLQCIPERVGIAATAWAIFAENAYSPLASSPLLAAVLPASRSVQVGKNSDGLRHDHQQRRDDGAGLRDRRGRHSAAHQTTNPATNRVTGTSDTPVAISSGGHRRACRRANPDRRLQSD
jgi:hypothetical protein